jgi:hypothetical protein
VHAPSEDKDDDIMDSFYEEVEQVFDQFPRYHMKLLMEEFKANIGREEFFKTIGNESLHEASNDKGVRVEKFAISKNLVFKSTFQTAKFINTLGLLLTASHIIM